MGFARDDIFSSLKSNMPVNGTQETGLASLTMRVTGLRSLDPVLLVAG